jgi:hypothetical protein
VRLSMVISIAESLAVEVTRLSPPLTGESTVPR